MGIIQSLFPACGAGYHSECAGSLAVQIARNTRGGMRCTCECHDAPAHRADDARQAADAERVAALSGEAVTPDEQPF